MGHLTRILTNSMVAWAVMLDLGQFEPHCKNQFQYRSDIFKTILPTFVSHLIIYVSWYCPRSTCYIIKGNFLNEHENKETNYDFWEGFKFKFKLVLGAEYYMIPNSGGERGLEHWSQVLTIPILCDALIVETWTLGSLIPQSHRYFWFPWLWVKHTISF